MGRQFSAPRPPELQPPWRTDERVALQHRAREFATHTVLPLADELDPQKGEMPRWLLDRIAEEGWFGITIPAEDGGLGLGVVEYCLVSEELARAWMSVGSILARAQGLGTQVLDDDRRHALLQRSARGEWIGAIALSEPDAGSDLANVSTRAVRDGDEWVLTGRKRWAGNALAADFVEVLCRVRDPEPGEPRSAGLQPFLVVKERGAFPAGMTGHAIDKIGYHGFLTWELELDGVRVPDSDRLTGLYAEEGGADDDPDGGFAAMQRGLNVARVHTAARSVALARAAVEDCTAYLQERVQFERPIGEFQALRFALAEMAAEVEQARAFTYYVANLLDAGLPAEREAAMVKLTASETAVRVTGQAMQLHGGNGYTTERRVERYWRDARLTTIFEGTSEIQKRIISDRLLPRPR
ncbi:MAG TPA: acyl-CoA dehydrogenase family protein [Mycobacteriales bacterium]|nr:acyl-CoA dehydrogenase family protein [Mycobacteriales bacterium]